MRATLADPPGSRGPGLGAVCQTLVVLHPGLPPHLSDLPELNTYRDYCQGGRKFREGNKMYRLGEAIDYCQYGVVTY